VSARRGASNGERAQRGLPPGQYAVSGFPRFGAHLHHAPPAVPGEPVIRITGAVTEPATFALADLERLGRRELVADFHCVAGWSATGLRWEGVSFAAFFEAIIAPSLAADAAATHLVFVGLDGYRCVVSVGDALNDDVLIADRLDGLPLDGVHGAPARLVGPSQYGYVSVKHLCGIELRSADRGGNFRPASRVAASLMVSPLFHRHPRARVWEEERNGSLPNWLLRPVYRSITPPIRVLSALGSRGRPQHPDGDPSDTPTG